MFRLASSNDLIRLKAKYVDFLYPEEYRWGLKQFGTLFCYDTILELRAKTVLEAGAGMNLFFDQNLDSDIDYWVADKSGFYGEEFNAFLSKRKRTSYVESLLGDFDPRLENEKFDLVFSISVLEHTKDENLGNAFADMARILKPGGSIVHTIDLNTAQIESRQSFFVDAAESAGFSVDSSSKIVPRFDSFEPILLEPLETVYKYYYKGNEQIWINPQVSLHHTASVVLIARKA